jgi:hypothetical protein
MRPVGKGRPGTQVIPTGWEAAHTPAVEGTMTAHVALREPGGIQGPFDETTGTYPVVPHPPYATMPARIQAVHNMARRTNVADDVLTIAGYLVTIPAALTGVRPGHLAAVVDSGDPDLDGQVLHVDDVVYGSLRFERDLFCSLHE